MKTNTATMSLPAATSVRYQRLLDVLELALTKSRTSIDISYVVSEFYGDENNEVFQTLIAGALDQAHIRTKQELIQFMDEHEVLQKLIRLEAVTAKLDGDEESQRAAEIKDKESTESAIANAQQFPGNLKCAEDLVRYQSYQVMKQEKEALEADVLRLEADICQLEELEKDRSQSTTSELKRLVDIGQTLEETADRCSMVS